MKITAKPHNTSQIVSEFKYVFFLIVAVMAAADVFVLQYTSDLVLLGILIFYAVTVRIYRFSSRYTFGLALVFLTLMYILFVVQGTGTSTEKSAVWVVLFMFFGLVQQWFER